MKKVLNVYPLTNYMLKLEFDTHEIRYFDVKPYLESGIFTELKDINYFNSVTTCLDSIGWKNGQDFSPETLYIRGVPEPIAS